MEPRILAKLRAEFEAGQPQADLLLIADSVAMSDLPNNPSAGHQEYYSHSYHGDQDQQRGPTV